MKSNKAMKKRFYLIVTGMVAICFCACGGPDELPPRRINVDNRFIIPQAKPLTGAERAIYDAKREEYNNAIK